MNHKIHIANCPAQYGKKGCTYQCELLNLARRNLELANKPLFVFPSPPQNGERVRIILRYKWWQNPLKWLKERRYCRVLELMANDPELTARRQKWVREAMLYGNHKPFEIWPHETPKNFWEKNYQQDIPKGFFEEVLPDLAKKGIIKP